MKDKATPPDPAAYPPGRLRGFVQDYSHVDYTDRRRLVGDWLLHWDGQGRASEALADLAETAGASILLFDSQDVYDVAFDVALRVQGRTGAYDWLVRAHIENHGWTRWWSDSQKTVERLKRLLEHFPDKWDDFIRDTSRSRYPERKDRNGITVGMSRLVFFLLEAGQIDLARRLTNEMVQVFRDEVSAQPIVQPVWAQ